jgi:hypothetical protein
MMDNNNKKMIKNNKVFISESEFLTEYPLDWFKDRFKALKGPQRKRINDIVIKNLGRLFDQPFSKFIVKNLKKEAKTLDLAYHLDLAINKKNQNSIKIVKKFIIDQMIDYFQSQVDRGIVRKYTKSKIISLGYKRAIELYFEKEDFLSEMDRYIDRVISGKRDEIFNPEILTEGRLHNSKSVYRLSNEIISMLGLREDDLKHEIHYHISSKIHRRIIAKLLEIKDYNLKVQYYIKEVIWIINGYITDELRKGVQNDLNVFYGVLLGVLEREEFISLLWKEICTIIITKNKK